MLQSRCFQLGLGWYPAGSVTRTAVRGMTAGKSQKTMLTWTILQATIVLPAYGGEHLILGLRSGAAGLCGLLNTTTLVTLNMSYDFARQWLRCTTSAAPAQFTQEVAV